MPKADQEEYTDLDEKRVDRGDFYREEEETDEEDLQEEETDEEPEEEVEEDEEGSEEDEEDSESEGDEDEDEEEDEDDEEEPRIPRSRLNQVIAQRDEEREQREWLEEQFEKLIAMQQSNQAPAAPQEPAKPKVSISALKRQSREALLEGDLDKVAEIEDQIDQAQQAEILELVSKAKEEAKNEATATLEDTRFERVIERAQEDFEFLDADSDAYDERAVKMINTVMAGKMVTGTAKSTALKEAIAEVVPFFEQQKPAPKKESLGKTRTKAARKKAAKAIQQQPPETRRAARGKAERKLDELDVMKMTDAQFAKLTAREKKALRGD